MKCKSVVNGDMGNFINSLLLLLLFFLYHVKDLMIRGPNKYFSNAINRDTKLFEYYLCTYENMKDVNCIIYVE